MIGFDYFGWAQEHVPEGWHVEGQSFSLRNGDHIMWASNRAWPRSGKNQLVYPGCVSGIGPTPMDAARDLVRKVNQSDVSPETGWRLVRPYPNNVVTVEPA